MSNEVMLTRERTEELAKAELAELKALDGRRLAVLSGHTARYPHLIFIHLDGPPKDGRSDHWATGVHVTEPEAMVKYRVRAMMAYEPAVISLYEEVEVNIRDHPDDPPPQGNAMQMMGTGNEQTQG